MHPKEWWALKRNRLTLELVLQILVGKGLLSLGLGALLACWIGKVAWLLVLVGLALDLTAKWRWLKR